MREQLLFSVLFPIFFCFLSSPLCNVDISSLFLPFLFYSLDDAKGATKKEREREETRERESVRKKRPRNLFDVFAFFAVATWTVDVGNHGNDQGNNLQSIHQTFFVLD